jgi:hypothetical protein
MKTGRHTCALLILLGSSLALSGASAQTSKQGLTKFDDFGYLNHENYSARLDNIATALGDEPNAQGYFIVYDGARYLRVYFLRSDSLRKVQNFIRQEKAYLLSERGLRASSIAVTSRTSPRRSVQLWIDSGSDY